MRFKVPDDAKTIAISGSRVWENVGAMKAYCSIVASTIAQSGIERVFVGDAMGVDAEITTALYNREVWVTVHHVFGMPRNALMIPQGVSTRRVTVAGSTNQEKYTNRDHYIIDKADLWLGIWNGKSPGTPAAYRYARDTGKLHALAKFTDGTMYITRCNYKPNGGTNGK